MPLTQGQHLNERYWIAALVEQGGFGAVYKAWDITLNRPVAIKEGYEDSATGQRQFLREAQLLANLSHPNLPRVIDFFAIHDQAQYLVMEFIEGMNLEELRVLAGGQLQMTQALGWTSQVLDALSYIHRQNPQVIHRDIKPTNIKVTPPDEDYPQGRAVLVDFGTAKAYEPSKRTTMGARAVTPGYSPHEQYGQANILTDARTDIYALGATLYMLLTGQEPPESVTRLLRDPLLPPRQLNPALPPELEATILKAMHNDPDERFQTAAEFKAAIQGLSAVDRDQLPAAGGQRSATSSPPVVVEPPAQRAVEEVKLPTPQPVAQPAGQPAVVDPLIRQPQQPPRQSPSGSGIPPSISASGSSPALPSAAAGSLPPVVRPSPWKWLFIGSGLLAGLALVALIISRALAPTPTPSPLSPSPLVPLTPLPGSNQISPKDGMLLSYIPAGTFQMGSESGDSNEQPVHTVTLDAFWMDQTEVTNAMYALCVADGACNPPHSTSSSTRNSYYGNTTYADYPVIYVDWSQAAAYCTWAGRELPTEAQWEYAARGGLAEATYPWGNESPSCTAGMQNGAQFYDCSPHDTIAVASFAPNGYGLFDIAGNVWEWVADWYAEIYYQSSPQDNPTGPASGDYRALRGSGWRSNGNYLRVSNRNRYNPDFTNFNLGFRCARSP